MELVKGGGKHYTKAELLEKAESAQKVRSKVKLTMPSWVATDPEAAAIWQDILKNLKGLDLLDNLDTTTLATYCTLMAAAQRALATEDTQTFNRLSTTALNYAKALGLTPTGRKRLARAKTDQRADPLSDLFGE